MLVLKNIYKDYYVGNQTINALKGLNITFRDKEFVSILGPSGCGKTTLLNIIGGLDQYTSGDLIINNKSTKKYKDRDWDTYRNHSIGFVFQSYNLIPHQTILQNVELALSIGGISKKERRQRAIDTLIKVGLKDKINKKPNQLSGGQCQRVAIARALVTNPDIIMADEPTGALDSQTSVQVLDLLKEIAKEKLVIMVTHNPDLAFKYSTRIIKMLDGEVIDDSNPVNEKELNALALKENNNSKIKKSYMSILEAIKLSGSNLLSKKRRTFITSFASSIGIIGIAVILSISSGMNLYIDNLQRDSSSSNFISIQDSKTTIDISKFQERIEYEKYPQDINGVIPYDSNQIELINKKQFLNDEYISYINKYIKPLSLNIEYLNNINLNIVSLINDNYALINTNNFSEIMENVDYLKTQYDVLATINNTNPIPTSANEVVLVIDEYNRLSTTILNQLGINYELNKNISYDDLLNKEFKLVFNDDIYTKQLKNDKYIYTKYNTQEGLKNAYENGYCIKIVSILRQKETASKAWISSGIGYTKSLTELLYENNSNSEVVNYQKNNPDYDVLNGKMFTNLPMNIIMRNNSYDDNMSKLGASLTPSSIIIYPIDFDSKDLIIEYLDNWNNEEIYKLYESEKINDELVADDYKVEYTDFSEILVTMLGSLIDIITYTLIVFSSISLVVSSIMIAIITYASVIERIKEIGIIRSLGGRKKDVSNVFIVEACITGFVSSIIALLVTLGINKIINIIIINLVEVKDIAQLRIDIAIKMILLSVGLNLIASIIPARLAAKKDPVEALRSE